MNAFQVGRASIQTQQRLTAAIKRSGPFSAALVFRFIKSLRLAWTRLDGEARGRVGPKVLWINRRHRLRIDGRRLASVQPASCWWTSNTEGLSESARGTRQFACLTYWLLTGKRPLDRGRLMSRERLENHLLKQVTTATAAAVIRGLTAEEELSTRTFVRHFGRSLLRLGEYQIEELEHYPSGWLHHLGTTAEGQDWTLLTCRGEASEPEGARSLSRFYLHAKLAMQLSPGPVPEIWQVAADGAVHYSVQDRLRGRYLYDLIQSDGPLPAPVALGFAAQLADRLAGLHQRGILLRNIQPRNLFLADGGEFLFTWLGDSRLPDSGIDLVEPNRAVGNRYFSAPEVMLDATSADETSDLFSLAAVLYFLLFGVGPFAALPRDLLYRHKMRREPWRSHLLETRYSEMIIGLFDRILCRRDFRRIGSAEKFAVICRRIQRRLIESP